MPKTYYNLDPQTYDDQFWWKTNDIEFWKSLLSNKEQTILELACGSGRIAVPFIREKYQYIGLDISKKYCQHAIDKLKIFSNQKIIYNYDMQDFTFDEKFDNIFIGFNSWLHLLNETDAVQCLNSIKKHMHKKSKFYIDIFVPSPLFLYRPKDVALPILEFFDTQKKSTIYVEEILDYDKSTEIANITWLYKEKEKYYMEFNFKMKMYYPDTINRLLTENNFIITNIWGNYQLEEFSEESNQQIYECQLNI